MSEDVVNLHWWLEAVIMASGRPVSEGQLLDLWTQPSKPSLAVLRQALYDLQQACVNRGVQLIEVASGYRYQVKAELAPSMHLLWEEKPARYTRAFLETLALIAYRQPLTRGEIEEIRGVSVSSSIFKTLTEEREWVRVVGYRAVPGRPALYATTKAFLDYFGLKTLQELPTLPEITPLDSLVASVDTMIQTQLELTQPALPEEELMVELTELEPIGEEDTRD